MSNPTAKAFRIAGLEAHVAAVLTALTSSPQSIPTLASALGYTQELVEHSLSALVDEGLATASATGDRSSRTYTNVSQY